jgi:hypothetical protein
MTLGIGLKVDQGQVPMYPKRIPIGNGIAEQMRGVEPDDLFGQNRAIR